ncbi:MAG TPA: DUF5660 family protein [Patescibacteria group bacterium]|nr:DUF5660 family protein [Patescibacteria group bacterium]
MSDSKKQKSAVIKRNVIESLKDLGSDFGSQGTDFLKNTSEDFFKELLGISKAPQPKRSGEMVPGQSLQMSEALSGKEEENKKLRAQISLERQLTADERKLSNDQTDKLRLQLQALTSEVIKVAQSTGNLAQETQIAMIEAPSNPGLYHIVFFEKVLEFLQSFRKKIDQASVWLGGANKRAEKKNYWSMYKKKGSSFLLSPDHYSQRSAG